MTRYQMLAEKVETAQRSRLSAEGIVRRAFLFVRYTVLKMLLENMTVCEAGKEIKTATELRKRRKS